MGADNADVPCQTSEGNELRRVAPYQWSKGASVRCRQYLSKDIVSLNNRNQSNRSPRREKALGAWTGSWMDHALVVNTA